MELLALSRRKLDGSECATLRDRASVHSEAAGREAHLAAELPTKVNTRLYPIGVRGAKSDYCHSAGTVVHNEPISVSQELDDSAAVKTRAATAHECAQRGSNATA